MISGSVHAQIVTEITVQTSVVAQGPLTFDVYFFDAVTGFDAVDDVSVSLTGSAAVGGVAINASSQQNYTVVLSGITGEGTLQLTIPAGRATSTTTPDTNLMASSSVITVDNTLPVVAAGALSRTFADTTDSSPITFSVGSAGASFVDFSAGDVQVSSTGTAAAMVSTTTPFGAALQLTAAASRPHDPIFDVNVGAGLTMEAWVRSPNDLPGTIVNHDEASGYGMRLEPGSSAAVMNLECFLGAQTFATTNSPVRAGQWHHLACTVGGGNVRLFVDGVEQGLFGGYAGTLTYGTAPLSVGLTFFNPAPWPAHIDELRIWSVARSAGELSAGMGAPLVGSPAGLLANWQFDAFEDLGVGPNAGSNDIRDGSSNSKHLDTNSGASLVESNALFGATVSLSNFAGDGSLTLSLAPGIASDLAGNQSVAVPIAPSITVVMSATAPQIVSITPDVGGPTNADTVTFRVIFSQAVTGFANDDLVITSPGLSINSTSITPIDASNYDVSIGGINGNGSLTLGIRAGAVQNSAMLFNTTLVNSAPLVIDNEPATPTLSSAAVSPLDGSPFVVNISFDEVVTGFSTTDLSVSNATLSAFSGSGSSYSVTVTPTAFGDVTVGPVAFGGVADLAGNGNWQGNSLSWTYPSPDTMPPAISSVVAPPYATTSEFSIDFVFTEDVIGFDLADLVFSTSESASYTAATLTPLSASRYRLDITGAAGQGDLVIEIVAGGISDATGNTNTLLTITQRIDLIAPSVLSSTVSPSAGAGVGQDVTFRIVADEVISTYNASLVTVITTGDAGYLAYDTGFVTVESTIIRIRFRHTGNGTLALRLKPGALIDRAGHVSTGTHTTSAITVDDSVPQLLSLEPSIRERQLDPDTVVFEGVLSEPVAALVQRGLTVDYEFLTVSSPAYPADLNSLVRVGSPEFVTPERFRIAVDLTRVPYGADFNLWLVANLLLRDAAGNDQNIVARRSGNPAVVDKLVTEATISTPRKSTNQSPIPITVTFTSATIPGFPGDVTGFDLTDIIITNGSASNLSGSGSTYTFDLTPTAEGEVSLQIPADAARDADDRPNRGTEFFYVNYDITAPEILAVDPKVTGNPNNDPGFLVYVQVSEPLQKTTLLTAVASNLVNNGSLRSFVEDPELDVPGVEVVRIGHFPGSEGFPAIGTVNFSVPAGAVTDLAGNASTNPFALPEPVAVDLEPPTVSASYTFVEGTNPIVVASDSISATEVTVEFNFEEAVLGLDESDIMIERDGPLGYDGTEFVIVSPTAARLTLLNVAADGVLTVSLREDSVTDALGNGNVETGRFSININNIPTEVVSITPESLEFTGLDTAFVVEWSKPVSGFDVDRFRLVSKTGFVSPVTWKSMTLTPIDTLRVRVDVLGLSGVGEFALEVMDLAATDRFNNPNLAGLTSPLVRRNGSVELGPFSILGGETDEFGDIVGRPDLTINRVFALRGSDSGPARLRWDGRILTMTGRFEVRTDPAMVLFESIGNLVMSIDSETGEFTFVPANTRSLSIGASANFSLCEARLVLDGRSLRLSGSQFPGVGFIQDAFLDPREPGNRIVLDNVSRYYPFSTPCAPTEPEFEVLSFTPTSDGFAIGVRARMDLVGERLQSDEPTLLEGVIELSGGSSSLLKDFHVRLGDFDWQAPNGRQPLTAGPTLSSDALQFPRLMREQAGLLLHMDELEIASDLTVTVPETLVATVPCTFSYSVFDPGPDGIPGTADDFLREETHCYNDRFLIEDRKIVLTMYDPIFGQDESGRGRISSADSEPMGTGQPRTAAEIIGPDASSPDGSAYILLPNTHTLMLGSGPVLTVPDTCVLGCGAATIDGDAYRAPAVSIESGLGVFRYANVAVFHDLRLSEGTSLSTAAAGDLELGGQKVTEFGLPFRITALNCSFGATDPPCRDDLELGVTVGLPTDFQMQESVTATFPFSGVEIKVVPAQGTWCTLFLPAGIPGVDFQINPFCLTYEEPPPTWFAEVRALIPVLIPPLALTGELTLKDGKWDQFLLILQRVPRGLEIPIGTSGAFVAGAYVGLENMAQEETCVERREFGFFGDLIEDCSVQPIEFQGGVYIIAGPALPIRPLFADVGTRINKHRIRIVGDVFLFHPATGVKFGNATGVLSFAGPDFWISSSQTTFPGLTAIATAGVGNLYVNGSLTATLRVPKPVPVIGGETISEVGMNIRTNPRSIKGYFKIFGIGFSAEINSTPQLVFSRNRSLRAWEARTAYQVDDTGELTPLSVEDWPSYVMFENFNSTDKQYYEGAAAVSTVDIGSSSPSIVRLSWENEGAVPAFTITGPDGSRYSPDTVETNPNVPASVGYIQNSGAKDASYIFSAPAPGTYVAEVGNSEALGEYAVELLVQNAPPSFEFVNVAATGDQLFLDWTASDTDDDAEITFYLDSDREDVNGRLLAGPFSESQTATVIDLAALTLAPGSYWVYAQVDDGANPSLISYGDEPIFIVHPDAPPAVRQIQAVASETTAFVEWAPSADPGIDGYIVKWTEDIEHDRYEESLPVEPHLTSTVVTGLTPNTNYKFTVVATKAVSDIGKRRATLRDVRDAAEGRAVNNPAGLVQLGDQIARLKASMQGQKSRPSANLNAFRFGQLTPLTTPLEDGSPIVESLVAEFDIVETIALVGRNNVPVFLSEPDRTVLSNGQFLYSAELSDRDGDALTLRLIEGPEGMTLENGVLSWTPDGEQGVFTVTLEVSDGVASRTQSWNLTSANLFADRLRIPTRNVGIVPPGEPFAFQVETLGGCGSPINYRLLTAPEGMTIDGEGLVEWMPPATDGSDAQFVVAASQVCGGSTDEVSRQYVVDLEGADGDVGQLYPLPSRCENEPTATIVGTRAIPWTNTVEIRVDLTGSAPWSLFWSDGEVMENIQTSPAVRRVSRTENTSYSLLAVADSRCRGSVSGNAVVGSQP